LIDEKKRGSKISWHCPYNMYSRYAPKVTDSYPFLWIIKDKSVAGKY
jgi:hypothetical protein